MINIFWYRMQVQNSNGGHRRQTLPAWMRRHLFPTDGPNAGSKLKLERWQSLFLTAIESEGKPIVSLRAASQVGKTLLALGVGLRAAVDGKGCLLASATETGCRDLSRRVEGAIERSPYLAQRFPSPRSGPGARASWRDVPHGEGARRKMLAKAEWVAQREDPTDPDSISFTLSRLDSARASLKQVTSEWRRARLAVERGDPNALRAFRNLNLGLPGTSGTADIDKLFELREDTFQLAQLEQVTAGVDVQSDRLVYTVLGFSPSNIDTWVLDYGIMLGDSREDEVWARLAAKLSRPFGGLPPSVVSVDAGYLTSTVQAQCARRRWWIPCVGRSGSGKPIARGLGPSGVCTVGKDNANSWWSGRVEAGAVHLPRTMTRNEIGELCASEVLVAEGGALRWRPVDGLENHLWDAAINCVHGRFFRTLSAHRRPFRLAAV